MILGNCSHFLGSNGLTELGTDYTSTLVQGEGPSDFLVWVRRWGSLVARPVGPDRMSGRCCSCPALPITVVCWGEAAVTLDAYLAMLSVRMPHA